MLCPADSRGDAVFASVIKWRKQIAKWNRDAGIAVKPCYRSIVRREKPGWSTGCSNGQRNIRKRTCKVVQNIRSLENSSPKIRLHGMQNKSRKNTNTRLNIINKQKLSKRWNSKTEMSAQIYSPTYYPHTSAHAQTNVRYRQEHIFLLITKSNAGKC